MADPQQSPPFQCPHCGGPLHYTDSTDGHVGVACEVGHSFDPQNLAIEQAATVSRAVWTAVRALQDRIKATQWMVDDIALHAWVQPQQMQAQIDHDTSDIALLQKLAIGLDKSILRDRIDVKGQL